MINALGTLFFESVPKSSVSFYMFSLVFDQASSITSHTLNSHLPAWAPYYGGFPPSQAHSDWYKRALVAEFRSRLKEAPLASLLMPSLAIFFVPLLQKYRTLTSESMDDGPYFGSSDASQVLRNLCRCQAPLRFGCPVLLAMSPAKYSLRVPRTTAIS